MGERQRLFRGLIRDQQPVLILLGQPRRWWRKREGGIVSRLGLRLEGRFRRQGSVRH
jgi:hypothetical protein